MLHINLREGNPGYIPINSIIESYPTSYRRAHCTRLYIFTETIKGPFPVEELQFRGTEL